LWDVQAGQKVRDVAFSLDGAYIVTASFDRTARLWLTDLDEIIRAVCALLARNLTHPVLALHT
jgi:WD40 repeat protein